MPRQFTLPWDPDRLDRSDQLLLTYVVVAPPAGAAVGDVELIKGGWSFARHVFANTYFAYSAGQFPADYAEFIWSAPVNELDLITLKPTLSPVSLLEEMYADGAQRASSDGLLRLLEAMFELSSQNKVTEVNWLMTYAKPEELAPEYSVGMLRATSNDFSGLHSWLRFRDKVRDDLRRRGFDAAQILVGLFDGSDI